MPIIHKPLAKTKKSVAANKPAMAQARFNAVLDKLRLANTAEERAMYMARLRKIQIQFKKGQLNKVKPKPGKKAA